VARLYEGKGIVQADSEPAVYLATGLLFGTCTRQVWVASATSGLAQHPVWNQEAHQSEEQQN